MGNREDGIREDQYKDSEVIIMFFFSNWMVGVIACYFVIPLHMFYEPTFLNGVIY